MGSSRNTRSTLHSADGSPSRVAAGSTSGAGTAARSGRLVRRWRPGPAGPRWRGRAGTGRRPGGSGARAWLRSETCSTGLEKEYSCKKVIFS